ncbi:anillin-like isoform X1 [Aphidius gifuensis]|uniref:anillin-like isoform X1 n=1 Tax=Aphidius gifuensis TaxID=684658 RepID=UPI001CDBB317|nr:anillin-like isoform X1 [Aphidius gifuensis]
MTKLSPNLKINIEIYNLKLKTECAYDDIIKRHINHSDKLTICPSPKKLSSKKNERHTTKVLNIKNNNNDDIKTSFKLSGRIIIDVKDLNLSSPWPLMGVPHDSILLGTIHFDLTPTINIAVRHKGFLTQCSEANGIPTRDVRWCVLKGRTLSLWKYQDDEETKEPLIEIDLVDCYTKSIQITSQTLCAKPKTILIETMRKRKPGDRDSMVIECQNNYTIVRYFLSCDTKKDLDEWIEKLNCAILLVRKWDDSVPYSLPSVPLVSDL